MALPRTRNSISHLRPHTPITRTEYKVWTLDFAYSDQCQGSPSLLSFTMQLSLSLFCAAALFASICAFPALSQVHPRQASETNNTISPVGHLNLCLSPEVNEITNGTPVKFFGL